MKAYAVTDARGRLRIAGMSLHELVRERPLRAMEEPRKITQKLHAGIVGDLISPAHKGFNGLAYFLMNAESCLANKRVMYGHVRGFYVIRCNGSDYIQDAGKIHVRRLGSGERTL